MCDKITISAYILKIVENDPFLRLQRRAKERFLSHVRTRLLNMTWSNFRFNV